MPLTLRVARAHAVAGAALGIGDAHVALLARLITKARIAIVYILISSKVRFTLAQYVAHADLTSCLAALAARPRSSVAQGGRGAVALLDEALTIVRTHLKFGASAAMFAC